MQSIPSHPIYLRFVPILYSHLCVDVRPKLNKPCSRSFSWEWIHTFLSLAVKHRAFAIQNEAPDTETSPPYRPVVGSAGSPNNPLQSQTSILRPGRALINPFDPSHVTIKLTSNRRRWTHIFPKGNDSCSAFCIVLCVVCDCMCIHKGGERKQDDGLDMGETNIHNFVGETS